MFRKLVSNLPFSPALVGQIGFYARRLRKEEATRRIGLFMTVLALVVQSLTVFVPSTSANASNTSDLITGGANSISAVLAAYDNPSSDFKKIMDYAGVTRAEIAAMKSGTINSKEYGTGSGAWLTWGRTSRFSSAQGEVRHDVSGSIVYSKPLWRYDTTDWTIPHGSQYDAFRGTSAKMGNFAIVKGCGNLVTRKIPPVPVRITVCRPGTGVISIFESEKKPTDLPANSDACKPKVPAAACTEIAEPTKIDRTHYSFKATASADNGATISSYTFVVHKNDITGEVVATKTITTGEKSAESGSIELKAAGKYYVVVIVKTSLGDKKSRDCETTVTVVPPEKCAVNPDLNANDPDCKVCAGNSKLWYKSPECREVIVLSKLATNITQNGVDATRVNAGASDRIEYKLTASNPGKVPATASFVENLDDVLEYATIQDNGGGTYDTVNKTLSWASVTLKPGETQTRTFIIAMPSTIPTTARGSSEPGSYDCIMNNTFGNNIQINVKCEAPKIVEQTVKQLPSTGPGENMLFAGTLLAVVTFFWARSRQLGTELRLVRKDFSASTI